MIAIYGTAVALCAMAVCFERFCCNLKSKKQNDKDQSLESDSSVVYIKISQPHRNKSSPISNTLDCKQNSIDSMGAKEMKQVAQDVEPVSSEEMRIVPVKPPRNQHRAQVRILSSALSDQLRNITNSSSEMDGTTKVVQAQIERNPVNSTSSEASEPLRCNYRTPSRRSSTRVYLKDEKTRKRSSDAGKKWKSLKKMLISSKLFQEMNACKDAKTNKTETLNVPVQTSKQCSPLEYSAILQKNRLVDASTSTRISVNASNARTQNDEILAKRGYLRNNVETPPMQPENDSPCSNKETLQEVASLIKNQSIDGKLICDVTITGLSMNQAQFLDFFETVEGSTRTASIVTTKEASIISIKFHHQKNNENSNVRDTFFDGCPLKKLYNSLPDIFDVLSISKLFKSQEKPERSIRRTPSIRVTSHSRTLSNSRNETSYIAFPKIANRFGHTIDSS